MNTTPTITSPTQGEWTLSEINGIYTISSGHHVICKTPTQLPQIYAPLGSPLNPDTARANARILVSSLKMRAALEAILAKCGEDYDEQAPFETIREHAAKALKAAREGNYA